MLESYVVFGTIVAILGLAAVDCDGFPRALVESIQVESRFLKGYVEGFPLPLQVRDESLPVIKGNVVLLA